MHGCKIGTRTASRPGWVRLLFCGRALSGSPYKRGPWHFRLSTALVRLLSLFSPPSTGFLLVGVVYSSLLAAI